MRQGQTTAKGTATRARIITTAAHLMFEKGVAETSVDDVCESAAVNASQIYHYFGDRRGLVSAVLDYQAERLGPDVPLDSIAALRSWARERVVKQFEGDEMGGCAYGSLAGQLASGHPEFREKLVDGFGSWLDRVEAGLARMQQRAELPPDSAPRTLALSLLAATQGGLLLSVVTQSTEPLTAALDSAITRIEALVERQPIDVAADACTAKPPQEAANAA